MGCARSTCCLTINRVDVDGDGTNKVKPSISTSKAFNTEFCRLRQSAIDNKAFRTTVDTWKPQSLNGLISLLRTYSTNKHPIDQTWIVFYWITLNISYDVDSYFNNKIPGQEAGGVFQRKRGVCEGFASLFLHLCTAIGLGCVKISGYAKGYGYAARGNKFDDSNHAWNAVKIGSFWYLVDSTWGEGSLNGNVPQKELQPYYFLVRPEQLVYTHLPEDKNWQLLADPLTMEKFLSLPKLWPPFFELHLEFVKKSLTNIVRVKPKKSFVEIAIRCPSDVTLLCSMKQNDQKVNGGDLIQYDPNGDIYRCLFAPKQSGWHHLQIFAKNKSTPGSYSIAVQFAADIPKGIKPITFPNTYGLFQEKKCCLYKPLSYVLQKGSKTTYRCRIPSAKRVALILDSNKWVYDDHFKSDTMNLTISVPEKSVSINAQFDNDKASWSRLVEYTVK